ncbi:hypothetical protein BpHYR1_010065 [Brachionus plicatilis]|uniref:Uncharacterized protein n=1 Tax=Brachionus plicatilis TaxID=10195 RepID=A0A3M7RCX2_BRAPC|nr:hypothetical protein BpHYR1_010065 [Brachionus plicatilis]
MALDSGCTTSILSRKFVERNKITVKESEITIESDSVLLKSTFLYVYTSFTASSSEKVSIGAYFDKFFTAFITMTINC